VGPVTAARRASVGAPPAESSTMLAKVRAGLGFWFRVLGEGQAIAIALHNAGLSAVLTANCRISGRCAVLAGDSMAADARVSQSVVQTCSGDWPGAAKIISHTYMAAAEAAAVCRFAGGFQRKATSRLLKHGREPVSRHAMSIGPDVSAPERTRRSSAVPRTFQNGKGGGQTRCAGTGIKYINAASGGRKFSWRRCKPATDVD
jgi:hypothetical protein